VQECAAESAARRTMGRRVLWTVAALAVSSGCHMPASQVEAPPQRNVAPAAAPLEAVQRGRGWYEAYCAECHGPAARGDGPLAAGMRPAPSDLTTLAARRGEFSAERVAAYVDGREYVEQHGPRGMPVWGRRLDDRLERSLEQELRLSPQMIAEITAYLELQQRAR
jgi:mono/diheme cytochrome c family protein